MDNHSVFSKPFTFDRTVRFFIALLLIAVLIAIVSRLSGVLLPFFAAWLIAYMLNPFVDLLQFKCRLKNRMLCVIITMVVLLGLIAAGIAFFASSVSNEVAKVDGLISNYLASDSTYVISEQSRQWMSSILDAFAKNKQELVQKTLPTVYSLLSSSMEYLIGLFVVFLMFLYIFFILMDFNNMSTDSQNLIPMKYRPMTHQVFHDLANGMNVYFRKQALISLIVGCMFAIGFKIIGLPMGVSMGLFIGVLNMVPYLHSFGLIPPIIVALIQSVETGQSFWLLLLGIGITFIIVQTMIDMVLTPKIMGDATGLKPAVILLALSIWGSLLGVLGMIIALPATTIMLSYYKHFVIDKKSSQELIEMQMSKKKQ
ncbi:MAG: AI-2E family transporter [Paludibacteraceae bacterium]|nr:AI-2E family transporter [Paludibacteraceae bacterium]